METVGSTSEQRGYAICTVPRSGSNWLCRLLAKTNLLGKPAEYFNGHGLRLFTDPEYPDDPADQVRRVLTTGTTANGVYGIKVFPWQLDLVSPHIRWFDLLPNLHFVHLARRDLLGQAISLHRAEQTKQWRAIFPVQGEASYDGNAILGYLQRLARDEARWRSFFARTGFKATYLIYEDLLGRPEAALHAVATLLHVTMTEVVNVDDVDITIQRDAVSDIWRARFLEEHGDGNLLDVL